MKFILITIFLSIFVFAQNTLTVSTHPSAHPYSWQIDGRIEGAAYKLIKKIANELGFKVEYRILPWARTIEDVKLGKVDMALTTFYTKQRAKDMTFLEYYDKSETSVFVDKDNNITFNKWEDLIGLTGLTIVGDSQGDKWDKFEKEHLDVLRVVNIEQVFKMIINKRADYAVFPKLATLREIKKFGYENKIIPLPIPVTSQGIYFALSKKSKFHHLIPLINNKIKLYRTNGVYTKFRDEAFNIIEKKHSSK